MPAARRLSPADRQGGRPGASAPAFARLSSLERSATNREKRRAAKLYADAHPDDVLQSPVNP